jgi:hypothetical protein
MSIVALESPIPVSPALSSSSWSTTSSGHRRPKTLYRKPVPAALEPPAFAFNFSFTPPASPYVGPVTPGPISFGSSSLPASSVHHLSLNSPYHARDLSSPEMHEAPSSEDGAYSSDDEIRAGSGPVRGAGLFGGFRLERDERYANPASRVERQTVGEPSKGRMIRDPETVGQYPVVSAGLALSLTHADLVASCRLGLQSTSLAPRSSARGALRLS